MPGDGPSAGPRGSDVRPIAFLTLADPADFVIDDERALMPLARRGCHVDTLPWNRRDVDWKRYELVVIRSTWDYQYHAEAFLQVLEGVEQSGVRLENGSDIVRWNMRKNYLRDLAARGVEIVPTFWRERLAPGELVPLFEELRSEEAVIKPVMSGNAEGAWRLDRARARALANEIEAYFASRPLMLQPFERGIVEEGEYSAIYLNGQHSHSILKVPKSGDFRVQEEHGAEIRSITPEPALRAAADAAIRAIGRKLLYARADLVRSGDVFRLMELELVEPSLYLRTDPAAPERFADAIAALLA
jgi:glutathione synthase/RimK-type ligase-like ATP-grasp enzyme